MTMPNGSQLVRGVSRRAAMKLAGVAALGLAFAKPIIESVRPLPVFGSDYDPTKEAPTKEPKEEETK